MKKFVFLTMFFLLFIPSAVFAGKSSAPKKKQQKTQAMSMESLLDELTYIELEISAVTTDMYAYGWMPEEKKKMKAAARKACDELDEIKRRLNSLPIPATLKELKAENLTAIVKLQGVYREVDKQSFEDIAESFASFKDTYVEYARELEKAWERYGEKVDLPGDFDPGLEEMKTVKKQTDRDTYFQACILMQEKKYSQAFRNLNSLEKKYEGTAFEDCVRLRMSDCLLMSDTDMDRDEPIAAKEGLSLLTKIISGGGYSPVLCEAFHKWRTVFQERQYGASRLAEIPNREYNKKRWKILKRIRAYSKKNPRDEWAKVQANLLMDLPNISREDDGGDDNLSQWKALYTGPEAVPAVAEERSPEESAPSVPQNERLQKSYRVNSSVLN